MQFIVDLLTKTVSAGAYPFGSRRCCIIACLNLRGTLDGSAMSHYTL